MIIIDRIDDGIAVLETDNGMQTIPAEQLPEPVSYTHLTLPTTERV